MFVVDASVLVSWLFPRDVLHERSRRWVDWTLIHKALLAAPIIVLPEVAGAVARRSGVSDMGVLAVEELRRLESLQLVEVDAELSYISALRAGELRMRGADAVYVALAERLGMPLVTWDWEQRERGRARVRVVTPEEALGEMWS